MIDSVTEQGATWAPVPEKFEAGTQDAAGIYATGVALDYLVNTVGYDTIATDPVYTGGEMIDSVTEQGATWAPVPEKFEAGTQDAAGIYATGVALDFLVNTVGYDTIAERERALVHYAMSRMVELPFVDIIGSIYWDQHHGAITWSSFPSSTSSAPSTGTSTTARSASTCAASTRTTSRASWTWTASASEPDTTAPSRCSPGMVELPFVDIIGSIYWDQHHGAISFNVRGIHPHDVASIMDMDGVCIRAGHHCAQPLLTWLKVENLACCRASIAFYNDKYDIDRFIESLGHVWSVFGHHCAQPLLTWLKVENLACCRASIAFYNDKYDIDRFIESLGHVWSVFNG